MENKPKQKKSITPYIMGFIILLLILILVIFIGNGGLGSTNGILLTAGGIALIVTGFLQIRKSLGSHPASSAPSAVSSSFQPATSAVPSSEVSAPQPVSPQASPSGTSSGILGKVGNWLHQFPKNKQILILVVVGAPLVVVLIVLIGLIAGGINVASPVGTWVQRGYEDRITYYFYEDETFVYMDNGEQSGSGYFVQTGKHVDLHWLTYYQYNYEDGYETGYYVISGDEMTSGGVILDRQNTD